MQNSRILIYEANEPLGDEIVDKWEYWLSEEVESIEIREELEIIQQLTRSRG